MMTKRLVIIFSAALCAVFLSVGFASAKKAQVKFFMTGDNCPDGWRHVTLKWVQKNQQKACRAEGMGQWHIARIANGGSQDGWGYKCGSREKDTRKLGGSLCVNKPAKPKPKKPQVKFFMTGENCPAGWSHVTLKWVQKNQQKACRAEGMGQWHIARIANGGSQDGWGYKCGSRAKDTRKLGGSLCVNKPAKRPKKVVTAVQAVKGEKCPKGWRHATYKWAKANQAKACRAKGMGEWHIVRLAGGGSQDGWGYKCRSRQKDDRKLGGSLCVQYGEATSVEASATTTTSTATAK